MLLKCIGYTGILISS